MAWLEGHSLCPVAGGRLDPAAFRSTGLELARLHAKRVHAPRRVGRAEEAREVREQEHSLERLLPELAHAARRVSAELAVRLSAPPPRTCVLHGDFSADQVILRGGEPVVIDWDRIAEGDPARDLGTFLARLDVQALDGAITADDAASAGETLVDGYASVCAMPEGVTDQRARALFALVTEGFRERQPEWRQRAEAILDRIDALLSSPRRSGEQPATPGLQDALDAEGMGRAVAQALGRSDPLHLEAHLVRHKPGRRALIRYDIASHDGTKRSLLGKLRAKGPDRRTPRLHIALRSAGLDGQGVHRVGVPAVLGCVEAPSLWLQPFLPGRTLTKALETPGGVAGARRAGVALAELHRTRVAISGAWSMQDELAVLERALARAAADLPARRSDIDAIRGACLECARHLEPAATTGIHRDFYPDQVLLGDEVTWLLDLDLHAEGDPAIDLGNFLAHLTELGLRLHRNPDAFAAHGRTFVAGYESVAKPLDHERVETLHRISLARHIHLSRVLPGRAHTTDALIELCSTGVERPPQVATSCAR